MQATGTGTADHRQRHPNNQRMATPQLVTREATLSQVTAIPNIRWEEVVGIIHPDPSDKVAWETQVLRH